MSRLHKPKNTRNQSLTAIKQPCGEERRNTQHENIAMIYEKEKSMEDNEADLFSVEKFGAKIPFNHRESIKSTNNNTVDKYVIGLIWKDSNFILTFYKIDTSGK